MAETLSLASLLVPSKSVEVEYPGMPDFKVQLTYLARDSILTLRKKATKTTFKNRLAVDELDDDLFLKLYVEAVIKGWKGLKLSYLANLVPIDIGANDPKSELPFTEDNALMIMKNSSDFDAFVSDILSDLGNFPTSSSKI